jgi:serine phosphatase RsbU (regulator of sigma subunit)/anti-sigma regulatory factor (Ser/Thr protein kinase)
MFKNVTKEEINFPAKMPSLRIVRDFIEQIGKKYKFSEKIINSFKLVVDEACTNIIRHGYMDNKDGSITIRAIIRRLSLTFVIIDQGASFDPRKLKNPDLQKYIQIGKKGGLGIFMMRKLMDDIYYNVTSHGNELRLTKTRDKLILPRYLEFWDSLTLRWKFFYSAASILALVAIGIFLAFNANIKRDIESEIYSVSSALTQNLSEIAWDPLSNNEDLVLFQHAQAILKNQPDMIKYAMITNQDSEVVAVYPVLHELVYNKIQIFDKVPLEQIGNVKTYRTIFQNESVVHFVSPIQLKESENTALGFAVISVSENYIQSQIQKKEINLIVYVVLFFAIGIGFVGVLVTQITKPFHKLADWVRQVGRGTVDEDEIDIDASDELGEIAQAFNEMTNKFRQAQINLIEQQRLQKELQVAQEIQQMLLPDDFPDVIGYDISSYYQAAKEVGGDLFDFVQVDDQSLGICVADVSGKGVPGSLVMTMIRTALRLESRDNNNPSDVLTKVNSFVTDDMRKGMFVTMFYVYLDSRERVVSYSSAGHNPMILYRGKEKQTYYLNPSGFPLGITLPDISLFAEKILADRIRLHPDDILVLYTDGITEAMNAKRELYGEERFLEAIRKYGHLEVGEFVKSIKEDILTFTGGFEQNDDITFVAIKENMAAVDVKVDMFRSLFERVGIEDGKTIVEACKETGISPSTYYRYKRIYEEGGFQLLREMLHGYTSLGLRHMSIEAKTKMYDIIRQNPGFGPKKLSDALNTEKYAFTKISRDLIYEELKRAKLNTKNQRINFVQRGGKRRLKPPGTPLLTLDGEVMMGFRSEQKFDYKIPFSGNQSYGEKSKERILNSKEKKDHLTNEEENIEDQEQISDSNTNKENQSFNDIKDNTDNLERVQEENLIPKKPEKDE